MVMEFWLSLLAFVRALVSKQERLYCPEATTVTAHAL